MRTSRLSPEMRSSQEFQSAVIRLSIWAVMLPILAIAKYLEYYGFTWAQYAALFGVHLVWYGALFASTVIRPALWPARTYLSILADLSGVTWTLYLTGDATAPFYLIYAWSFLSQGARYGKTNLLIASLCSLVAFNAVALVLGDWVHQTLEVAFISLVLVVLPAYEFVLLRRLQNAKQAAESANRARGDFLATMTHELRTPLSGVIGMAQLLRRTRLDEEQREYLDSINSSADVLQALIGDILDLSKIDAGKLELKPGPFDLRDTLNETCWALSSQALDKGVELICRVAPDLPREVYGDELRLRQILFNLIGNAIKFTDRGHVCVHANGVPDREDGGRSLVQVAIRDTGVGIPADRIARVFDTFWQADPSSTRRHGGTGLGTAIARDLTEMMGGRIDVVSTHGQGSTFTVRLPLLGQTDPEPPRAPERLRGVEVMVFEQNEESAQAIMEICAAAGMRPQLVGSIEQLGVVSSEVSPGRERLVLIVDAPRGLDLDRTGGLVRKLFGEAEPLVYLHYPRRQPGSIAGPSAQALKPVSSSQLWDAMLRVLSSGESAPATVEELRDGPTASPPIPETGSLVLVAEDDAINAKLIHRLLQQAGCRVTLVEDGRAALDAALGGDFELALIDLRMPHMDGIDFTRNYRAREPADSHLPIVALTANAAEDAHAECLEAGMDDFLTKPVDPETLQGLIRRYGLSCQSDGGLAGSG